nr:hypothetical protein [Kibdelosporangium sp. MJ126-NF4]
MQTSEIRSKFYSNPGPISPIGDIDDERSLRPDHTRASIRNDGADGRWWSRLRRR